MKLSAYVDTFKPNRRQHHPLCQADGSGPDAAGQARAVREAVEITGQSPLKPTAELTLWKARPFAVSYPAETQLGQQHFSFGAQRCRLCLKLARMFDQLSEPLHGRCRPRPAVNYASSIKAVDFARVIIFT